MAFESISGARTVGPTGAYGDRDHSPGPVQDRSDGLCLGEVYGARSARNDVRCQERHVCPSLTYATVQDELQHLIPATGQRTFRTNTPSIG
jgi:hypothetical protein